MLKDLADLDPTETYPVVIIGAGAAGLTIASRLDKAGVRLLLAESGGFESESRVQDLYKGENVGLPYNLTSSRLRYFGGTTNHWNGQSDALSEQTLARRDWVPFSGWPISHRELAAYLPEAFEICNLGPYGQEDAICNAFERPFPPATETIDARIFKNSSPIARFAEIFRDQIVDSENVDLVLSANAVELITDSDGTRVSHMHFKSLDGKSTRQPARFVVVACGGIENPRLLLASNSARPRGLGNERDLVGRFFMEHPAYRPFEMALAEGTDISSTGWTDLKTLNTMAMTLLACTPTAQAREEILQFGWLPFNRSRQPEAGLLNAPAGRAVFEGTWAGAQVHDRAIDGIVVTEQAPNPDSRITLTGDHDALGMPRLALDWRLSELERHTLRRGTDLVARELTRHGLARVRIKPWVEKPDSPPATEVGYGNHHMGTTRMGETPLSGVVDPNCRVHSVPNLYIAGSSVFPTSGLANPTVNIVALALRLANHLEAVFADNMRLSGRRYRLGKPIDFTSKGRGQRFTGKGWSHAEPTGTWTSATTARLSFQLVEIPRRDMMMTLTAHPFLGDGKIDAQVVRIRVGRFTVAHLRFSDPGFSEHRIKIPSAWLQEGKLNLDLSIPKAVSPLDLGLSSDGRTLGIKVKSARISQE